MDSINQKFVYSIVIIAVCVLSSACRNDEPLPEEATGKLNLKVGLSLVVNEVENPLKSTSIENLKVEIFSSSSTEPVVTFAHVTDIPEALELSTGIYYATAVSENNPVAAFETPYYYGESESFTIMEGETTQVGITCSLANIMLTVLYSDQVISSFTDYSTTVSNANGTLLFSMGEERAGYFNAGPLSIESELGYSDGATSQTKTISGIIASPQPGKHYEIHVDAALNDGNAAFNISLDEIETEIITITDEIGGDDGELVFGDLLITEIMYNPGALADSEGEWVEVFNNSSTNINLKGLVLRRGSNNAFYQIAADVNLASGAYAVLGRTESAADYVDCVYGGGIDLVNTGYELFINTYGTNGTDGTVICSVDYGADSYVPDREGKSIQLDPAVTNALDAQDGLNWCSSTLPYSTGDLGTPGAANSSCE
ncbi:DUF4493 domain-containing protein [Sunxiuqinia sp. sy24]|uniref:DUF4493 domain-containing protein n=1 Tax=Sunxiuqinia sp. sy24 TaxID=3461495 RepID=UPI0040452C59